MDSEKLPAGRVFGVILLLIINFAQEVFPSQHMTDEELAFQRDTYEQMSKNRYELAANQRRGSGRFKSFDGGQRFKQWKAESESSSGDQELIWPIALGVVATIALIAIIAVIVLVSRNKCGGGEGDEIGQHGDDGPSQVATAGGGPSGSGAMVAHQPQHAMPAVVATDSEVEMRQSRRARIRGEQTLSVHTGDFIPEYKQSDTVQQFGNSPGADNNAAEVFEGNEDEPGDGASPGQTFNV